MVLQKIKTLHLQIALFSFSIILCSVRLTISSIKNTSTSNPKVCLKIESSNHFKSSEGCVLRVGAIIRPPRVRKSSIYVSDRFGRKQNSLLDRNVGWHRREKGNGHGERWKSAFVAWARERNDRGLILVRTYARTWRENHPWWARGARLPGSISLLRV